MVGLNGGDILTGPFWHGNGIAGQACISPHFAGQVHILGHEVWKIWQSCEEVTGQACMGMHVIWWLWRNQGHVKMAKCRKLGMHGWPSTETSPSKVQNWVGFWTSVEFS